MVPSGWKKYNFGDLVTLKSEKFNKSNPKNEEFQFSIELDNISQETGKIIGKTDISQVSSTKNIFRKNDVLYGKLRPYLRKYANPNFEGVCSTEIWVFTAKNPNILNEYIFLLIQTHNFNIQANITSGTKMPRASWEIVSQWNIPLPPLAEQEKIAEILSTWDQAIDSTEKLIANAELQKKALMQQLLTGKKRLLNENGERFSGKWEKVKLGDIAQTINGLSGKTKADFGSGSPFITYMNVYSQSGIKQLDRCDYVNIDANEKQTTVKKGDVFFTTSSETPHEVGLSSVLLIEPKTNTYLNSFCFGIRFKNKNQIVPEFAQYLFRGAMARKKISILAQGSTRFNLSKNNFMQLIFQIPNLSEQQKIAEVLSTADREIELLTEKLEYLKAEKKALMQQLLTGKRRVKVA